MSGCLAQGLACAMLALSPPAPFTAVGANVQASSDDLLGGGRDQQVEPYLAVDPLDPARLVAGAQEGRMRSGAAKANGFYASADGGTTWTRGRVPGLTAGSGGGYDRASDPVLAFGPDGTAYYSSLVLNFSGGFPRATAILVNRSSDSGVSWSRPATAARAGADRLLDEPWLAVDGGGTSPRRGAVYLSSNDANLESMAGESHLFVTRSDDGGRQWRKPVVASGGAHIVGGARVAVGPDGTVHLLYAMLPFKRTGRIDPSHDLIRVTSSTDGGATWSRPVTVAHRRFPEVADLRVGSGTAAAVDATTGTLHAVWIDMRRGAGDVVTSHLDAGARRWSRPVRVGSARDVQFTPAVAAAGGSVHLLFYDRRSRHRCDVLYVQSLDGGRTFRAPLRVNSAPFDPLRAERDFRGRFLGDYIGIAATDSFAQAIWVDDRSPTGNDVYTARISG